MTFSELLSALGMETHLDLSAAAAAGGCTIQFDGKFELALEADADSGAVQLYVEIAQLPPSGRENFYAVLLQLHLFGMATGDGVFGLDPDRNRVLFFKKLPLALLDRAEALRQVEAFVNQAERWRDRLPEVAAKLVPESAAGGLGLPVQRA